MTITKQTVADKIAAYLHHEITLAQLVDWSERALMDGELAERDAKTLSSVIARLGVADMRAFGLAWEDCEELLRKLGFSPRVSLFVHASEIINHFGRKRWPARRSARPESDHSVSPCRTRMSDAYGHDSSFSPLTRWNSRTLLVTSVRPPATACPAMSKS